VTSYKLKDGRLLKSCDRAASQRNDQESNDGSPRNVESDAVERVFQLMNAR
jgi:hypothetical protein